MSGEGSSRDGGGEGEVVSGGNGEGGDESVDERLPVGCAGEEWCPVTTTATLIGRKWHPVILHRLVEDGPAGFNELEGRVDGISSKVLSESLDDLEENGLVDRERVSEKPVRVRYSLTDAGASLDEVVYAMRDWGTEHLVDPADADVDGT
ncbi:helix-turn-helix domain-containing protein [Halorubellus sp. PRR65]|uniref:winged helix-turn-helix transcriptional regulator n=1 Tax=Halorubellus sp. PRR65 TaxID=3098148 RepID=UPI002B25FFB8|nr:helix-turn-helix domain-containing protein [Halorubellus sp. PRR65]